MSTGHSDSLSREQRLWRWRILISTYLAYAGFYLVRKVFTICKTTLAAPIEEGGYGIGFTGVANIWTAFLVAYMLGQFLHSYLGRKWGPRVLLLGGLGISIACNIVFGFANSYNTFLIFMFFNGLVQAAGWPASVGAVAEWLRKEDRGTLMGIWSTSYVIGNLVVKIVAGTLLLHYTVKYDAHIGVRYAFFSCTLLAFAIWWIVYFWQRTRPEDVGLPPIVGPEDRENQSVQVSNAAHIGFGQYLRLVFNPVVPLMGCAYFCIKFLRYALDSWLPTFLDLQGMDTAQAAYYSSIFDWTGLVGAIMAGILLDRVFRGRWELLCLVLGVGIVIGYLAVVEFGAHPIALAVSFGLVGFMLYGPDTILAGAGAIIVAGERNGVAVAGIVNGIASIGPVVQEQVIGWLLDGADPAEAIRNSNLLGLGMSLGFVALMSLIAVLAARRRRAVAPVG
jgi:sugar phosphate permease